MMLLQGIADKGQIIRQIITWTILCLIFLPLLNWFQDEKETSCVRHEPGIFHFSECPAGHFEDPMALDGQWLFDWKHFSGVASAQVRNGEHPERSLSVSGGEHADSGPVYVHVPGNWNVPYMDYRRYPAYGYATYRTTLIFPESSVGQIYGVRISSVRVAHRLYLDGQMIAENGIPSIRTAGETGKNRPYVLYFEVKSKQLTLAVEVSNHQYLTGGIDKAVMIGTSASISRLDNLFKMYDVFIIATLFCLAVFFIGQMLQTEWSRSGVCFGFISLVSAFFWTTQSEKVIYEWLPDLTFAILHQVALASGILLHLLFIYFIYYTYPLLVSNRWLLASLVIDSILIGVVLAGGSQLASALLLPIFVWGVATTAYYVFLFFRKNRFRLSGTPYYMLLISVSCTVCVIAWMNHTVFGEMIYSNPPLYVFVWVISMSLIVSENQEETLRKLNETELDKLRHQIKPHFLYNSLNTVMQLIRKDPLKAERLLADFSAFLRGSFRFEERQSFIPLESELNVTKAYLAIESARFGDSLKVDWQIDAPVDELMVPPLVLQPIVENAVRHGLRKNVSGGRIQIRLSMESEHLIVEIVDSGPGFTSQQLNHWQRTAGRSALAGKKGVGLMNVNLRLLKLYGEPLMIENDMGGGALVRLRIPSNTG